MPQTPGLNEAPNSRHKLSREMQFLLERQRNEEAALDALEMQFGKMNLNILHLQKGAAVCLLRTVTAQTIF